MSTRQDLVRRLSVTRKYRHLCPDVLERVADWAVSREPLLARASLTARRKLHQIYGAFWRPGDHDRLRRIIETNLEASNKSAPGQDLESMCRAVLGLHASTRERIPRLERCYRDLWAITGPPDSVADLACGLSPFALPWMGLPEGCVYSPSDIDSMVMALVNRYLGHIGRTANARCLDLLSPEEPPTADVILILKTLSCLERQERQAAADILGRLKCRWLVISMPTHSLGGNKSGMAEGYRVFVRDLLAGHDVEELSYPDEVFFVGAWG